MAFVQNMEGGDPHSHGNHHNFDADPSPVSRKPTMSLETSHLLDQNTGTTRSYTSSHFSHTLHDIPDDESNHEHAHATPATPYFTGHHRFEPSSSHSMHRARRNPSIAELHDSMISGISRRHSHSHTEENGMPNTEPASESVTKVVEGKHQIVNTIVSAFQVSIVVHVLSLT